jgi:hypothetical protein
LPEWILLHYKIPSEPSASRVYIWRKLKRLGALLYLDSVWVLPDTPRTLEQFQWLSSEIVELGGEAALWKAQAAQLNQDESISEQFSIQVDAAYHELMNALLEPDADLEMISRQYQRIKSRDYFNSPTGQKVREVLIASRGEEG